MTKVSSEPCDAASVSGRAEDAWQAQEASVLRCLHSLAYRRDSETAWHTMRMARYAAALAAGHGVDAKLQDLILLAAPLHDIGKLGTPDAILLKRGPLTEAEWVVMKQHTILGHDILSGLEGAVFAMGAEISLSHHERWDGSGYPHGLTGSSIPLAGRIVAVADVFDALTSARPYKAAWSCDEALGYISRNAGSLFDPEIVQVLHDRLDAILCIKARFRDAPALGRAPTMDGIRGSAHPSTAVARGCTVC